MKVIEGTIASPQGFHADGIHAGFKQKRLDLGWLVSDCPASVAGVYTTNQVVAAPLILTKETVQKNQLLQAIVVNSGVANSCTGQEGMDNAKSMQVLTAQKLGLSEELVAVASTGVIGTQIPMNTFHKGLVNLSPQGDSSAFAKAILTTDTGTKTVVVEEEIGGVTVTMAGVAKGSGMIHPNMATMLGFITCDAVISSQLLQEILSSEVETTFNQITVDGDTSTNDMVLVMANGCAQNAPIQAGSLELEQFRNLLNYVMTVLAKKIAQDGEGATKLIQVDVAGASDEVAARMIAKAVVGSSLVKTAIFGADPNWGRVISAIGYAGVPLQADKIDLSLAGIAVLEQSTPLAYDQEKMQEALKADTIQIGIQLQEGQAKGCAWGCDLSYDYVKINALYHT